MLFNLSYFMLFYHLRLKSAFARDGNIS